MRTLILGFDSFDPTIYQGLAADGKMPNLQKLALRGGYSSLKVSNPPQTEVSWTSIATGADPGEHGVFDFVHRDPATYSPFVSILVTKKTAVGLQYVRPYTAHTIFDEAIDQGYPATALWWPAMFPSSPESAVNVIPGLGTPDVKGQLGVGMQFSAGPNLMATDAKTKFGPLTSKNGSLFGYLEGPLVQENKQVVPSKLEIAFTPSETGAKLKVNGTDYTLQVGQWSPYLQVKFRTQLFFNVQAVTRAIITSLDPFTVYFLPVQIHPLHTAWRYGAPGSFVKEVWNSAGPFLTLGWPQDTNGLEDDCITDSQFIDLCADIFATREQILVKQLDKFKEGILASIFDDLDRIQHMFRRRSPAAVIDWYLRLDAFVGRMLQIIDNMPGKPVHLLVLSDHGFADYVYQFNLNRWLIDNGYMAVKDGASTKDLSAVDWSKTQAYAIGLNSLYLNLAGREGQGCVSLDQIEPLTKKIQQELKTVVGPTGDPVFSNVYLRHEAFSGPLLKYGPDLVLGYAPGYRASSDTGLGKWSDDVITVNDGHWEADHCIDVQKVPGVIFSNRSLDDFPNPTFRDIPAMVVGKYFEHSDSTPPVVSSGEDQKTMEERLKGLGYL